MRRPVAAVVVAGAVLALVAAFAPPFTRSTEAPSPAPNAGQAAPPASSASPGGTSGALVEHPTTPAAAPGSGTASPAGAAPGTSNSLVDTVHRTITSASQALSAAAGDDRVQYAAGLRARDAGAYGYAIDAWRGVVARGGPLAPIADLRMAQAMVSAGRRTDAAAAFADTLARGDLPPELVTAARFDAADNAVALHQNADALRLLHAIRDDTSANAFDRSSAAWKAAQIRRDAGDGGWTADAVQAVMLQPGSSAAGPALDALVSAGALVTGSGPGEIPALTAAHTRYLAHANDKATARYRAILNGSPSAHDAAIAWFYLGALDERANAPVTALADYARSIATDPGGPLADDARYWRARIYDERGDVTSAVSEYDRLVHDYPSSPFAPDAQMRAALLLALHGDSTAALQRFAQIAGEPPTAEAAAAARWSQVFRAVYGLPADPALTPQRIDPAAFPSLIGTGATDPLPATAFTEQPVAPSDAAAIVPWMASTFGPAPASAANPLTDVRYQLGRILVGVGETSVGRAILSNVIARYRADPYALLTLARAARDIGLPDLEVNAAGKLLSSLSTSQLLSAPRSMLALSYPTPFLNDLGTSLSASHVPVLLMMSLVRQESAFDPTAGSSAGAMGLAQVTPGTGKLIAQSLGVDWTPSMLLDPATSLRFGAYYLGTQLQSFGGNVLAALAAYNAGPGNATRWASAAPFTGPDGYLLAVDYSETSAYLTRVLENYAWYRYIYGAAAAPSLP